jgi:hypothetical protein
MINPGMTSSLSDWLVAGAPPGHDFSGLVGEVGRRLVSAGMELDWFGIHLHVIFPDIPADPPRYKCAPQHINTPPYYRLYGS